MLAYVKLISGEEIVGRLTDQQEPDREIAVLDWSENCQLNNPVQVVRQGQQIGGVSLPIVWLTVSNDKVVFAGEPDDKMADLYAQLTNSVRIVPAAAINRIDQHLRKG